MTRRKLMTTLATLAGLSTAGVPHAAPQDIEGPQYEIIKAVDGVELRRYAPYLVAEVTVEAPSRDAASSKGFRPLAGYIFGGNTSADQIAMTAPVTTQAAKGDGTKIAMTSPVTSRASGDGFYTVQFTMPRKWTMETLPIPDDSSVTLKEVSGEDRLAYRFVGEKTSASIAAAERAIAGFAAREGMQIGSNPIVAGYDGPRVPTAKRRWEVLVTVE